MGETKIAAGCVKKLSDKEKIKPMEPSKWWITVRKR
jgi:hypothetical protein